jgi:hypothetical protein
METGNNVQKREETLTWRKCQTLKTIFQINKHSVAVSTNKAFEGERLAFYVVPVRN